MNRHMRVQPTQAALEAALTAARDCEVTPGVMSEAFTKLKEMRALKTTWIGYEENDLMLEIDNYIRGRG